jgi:diguanylate cyclase (GGDEF)-like protein
MSDARPPGMPADLVQRVRTASVPPYLRALFRRLGVPVRLRVEAPAGASSLPAMALQLCKLGTQGTMLGEPELIVVAADAPPRVHLEHAGRSLVLDADALIAGNVALARRIANELLDPAETAEALERFAREAPRQDALRRLTRAMLETQSIERLRQITLLGMTSAAALGFDRAALFVHDEEARAVVGSSAIGPYDDDEAHQVWEAIELHDKTLEELIVEHTASEIETRFEGFVRSLDADIAAADVDDEVVAALAASGPLVFTGAPIGGGSPDASGLFRMGGPISPLIAQLDPPGEFLVCAIKLRGKALGVVFADNRYSGAPIEREALGSVGFLLDASALVLENLRLLESVETLARHDALTGLFNRREFETRMQEEQSRAQRLSSQCALLLLDVDHFKAVNEAQGPRAGDELLQLVGVLLRSTLRAHDIVARFGGDVFAVLVTDTTTEQVRSIVRRVGAQALQHGISLSIGGSLWPRENLDTSVLYAEADACLYAAKRAGRGRASVEGVAIDCVFEASDDLV